MQYSFPTACPALPPNFRDPTERNRRRHYGHRHPTESIELLNGILAEENWLVHAIFLLLDFYRRRRLLKPRMISRSRHRRRKKFPENVPRDTAEALEKNYDLQLLGELSRRRKQLPQGVSMIHEAGIRG